MRTVPIVSEHVWTELWFVKTEKSRPQLLLDEAKRIVRGWPNPEDFEIGPVVGEGSPSLSLVVRNKVTGIPSSVLTIPDIESDTQEIIDASQLGNEPTVD